MAVPLSWTPASAACVSAGDGLLFHRRPSYAVTPAPLSRSPRPRSESARFLVVWECRMCQRPPHPVNCQAAERYLFVFAQTFVRRGESVNSGTRHSPCRTGSRSCGGWHLGSKEQRRTLRDRGRLRDPGVDKRCGCPDSFDLFQDDRPSLVPNDDTGRGLRAFGVQEFEFGNDRIGLERNPRIVV